MNSSRYKDMWCLIWIRYWQLLFYGKPRPEKTTSDILFVSVKHFLKLFFERAAILQLLLFCAEMLSKQHIGCLLILMELIAMTSSLGARRTQPHRKRYRSSPHNRRHGKERWLNPCAGKQAVADVLIPTVADTESPAVTDVNLDTVRQSITDRIEWLIRDIDGLKKHYVSFYFCSYCL